MFVNTEKQKIRKEVLSLRAEQGFLAIQEKSKTIAQNLFKTPEYQKAKSIAVYFHNSSEVTTDLIIQRILQDNKACYVPVLDSKHKKIMHFALFNKDDLLIKNRYGILEPNLSSTKTIHPSELDLILLPLVAYDKHNNRLGMGGGFYDRTLSDIKRLPRLFGLAFALQEVVLVPTDEHDIALHKIITEKTLLF